MIKKIHILKNIYQYVIVKYLSDLWTYTQE